LCTGLTAEGYVTWSLEYRRLGNVGGGWPGTFLDVAMGAKYVRELAPEYNLDLNRVVAIGHSAGGHLALWLAGCHRIARGEALHVDEPLALKGVVALAGVSDLRRAWELRLSNNVVEDFLGGAPSEVPERYATASPLEMVPLGVPQVLVHGTADDIVPYEICERYYEAALGAGDRVELVRLEGTGHFELIDPAAREWGAVVGAVRSLLSV
jgi:acetyl esterase/lipase